MKKFQYEVEVRIDFAAALAQAAEDALGLGTSPYGQVGGRWEVIVERKAHTCAFRYMTPPDREETKVALRRIVGSRADRAWL